LLCPLVPAAIGGGGGTADGSDEDALADSDA